MIGLPEKSLPWAIPFDAVTMLAAYEQGPAGGVALRAYRCPAGIPTIGWGRTQGVKMGDRCTKDEADRWLCADVAERANRVRALCTETPGDNELAALVVLAYNIGVPGLAKSTVLRQHNAGNRQAAARAFSLWNKAKNPNTGQLEVLAGLTARRAREAAMYLTPDEGVAPATTPQAVEAESSLVASPIAQSGAVTVGAGALAGASEIADQLNETSGLLGVASGALTALKNVVGQMADLVGMEPRTMLALALIGAGVVVIRQRTRQRAEGWA